MSFGRVTMEHVKGEDMAKKLQEPPVPQEEMDTTTEIAELLGQHDGATAAILAQAGLEGAAAGGAFATALQGRKTLSVVRALVAFGDTTPARSYQVGDVVPWAHERALRFPHLVRIDEVG